MEFLTLDFCGIAKQTTLEKVSAYSSRYFGIKGPSWRGPTSGKNCQAEKVMFGHWPGLLERGDLARAHGVAVP